MKNTEVIFQDWGLIDYQQAWDKQEQLLNKTVDIKTKNRELNPDEVEQTNNYLVFCEHPHVYTLGKSGIIEHLLLDEEQLKEKEATFYKINRGGDITYHGPGQIVGYPIIDLENFFTDIHQYLRQLEEAVINTLKHYGIESGRIEGLTGVWLDTDSPKARKICAMGVRCSRWVTMHGLALNVNTELDYFKNIIPCGIDDKAVTSISKELGKTVDVNETKEILKKQIVDMFGMTLV